MMILCSNNSRNGYVCFATLNRDVIYAYDYCFADKKAEKGSDHYKANQ
jgi:hypothetical protein